MDTQRAWMPKFLASLRDQGFVTHACKAAGIARGTAYEARKRDPEFAAAWDEADDVAIDDLRDSLFKRARDGWDEPVFFKGSECGAIRRFDNSLGMWFLKKRRPEVYGDEAQPTPIEQMAAAINAFVQSTRAQNTAEGERFAAGVVVNGTGA